MMPYPIDWSLNTVVDDFLGTLPDHITASVAKKGLANWYRLSAVLAAQQSTQETKSELACAKEALWGKMTVWHRHAYRLLYEWWTASYQDPAISLAGILDIVDNTGRLDEEGASKETWRHIMKVLELKRWPSGDIKSHNNGKIMHYNERMFTLFRWEFDSNVEDPVMEESMTYSQRRNTRSLAALYAYCQQLSWSLLYDTVPVTSCMCATSIQPDRNIPTESRKPNHLNTVERLWNTEDPFTSVTARGPIIEACQWLRKTKESVDNLPYYLWDIENARTVESSQLDSFPEYTAVSHTWGRWITGEPVEVEGVPWKVPQNTKFRIQDVAILLRGIPGQAPYIWLDLVCIPQDNSLLGTKEIARQAKIFNAAQYVVAWFNEVDNFDGLRAILTWQAIHLLHVQDREEERRRMAKIDEAWGEIAWKPSGLLQPRSGKLEWANLVLNPWYTSLWTLQEVALRPDIWMCSKDWQFLTLDGITPLPFSGFVAIFEIFWQDNEDKRQYPYLPEAKDQSHISLFELGVWRFETGLSKILSLDQVTLLTLGDRRECLERRGEAIMSALGITAWYDHALARVQRDGGSAKDFHAEIEQTLILKKYPLDFVRELSEKCPGDFFGGFFRLSFDTQGDNVLAQYPGSLLPFSETKSFYTPAGGFRMANLQVPNHTHTSVNTWQILTTGQVHIPEACVVDSTIYKVKVNNDCVVPARLDTTALKFGPRPWVGAPLSRDLTSIHGDRGMDFSAEGWFDLYSWMESQQEETHAILVQYQLSEIGLAAQGIIIKRQASGTLRKTDMFFLMDEHAVISLSDSQKIDIIVE